MKYKIMNIFQISHIVIRKENTHYGQITLPFTLMTCSLITHTNPESSQKYTSRKYLVAVLIY